MNFKELKKDINLDLTAHGVKSPFEKFYALLFNASFRLLLNYRIGKYFFEHKLKIFRLISSYYKYKQITKRNCYLSFNSKIGAGVKFPHPLGIVIGEEVIIKDNVTIWQ